MSDTYFSSDGTIQARIGRYVVEIRPTDAPGVIRVNTRPVNMASESPTALLEEWTKVPGNPLEIRQIYSIENILYFEVRRVIKH